MANSLLQPSKIAKRKQPKAGPKVAGYPQAMARAKAIPKAKGPGLIMKMAKGKL
jgi:hypothetical protein